MPAYAPHLREEELKNRVAADVFGAFDCARILGAVDFCVSVKVDGTPLWEPESLLWAEAKAGVRPDLVPLFAQLVLTIGKARTFDDHLPPPFLGAFDAEKIAFVPYHEIVDLFYQSDFNWNVAPSDPSTREFRLLADRIAPLFPQSAVLFRFAEDAADLAAFVRRNFAVGRDRPASLAVTRNNFVFVYQKWVRDVKPSIAVDWDGAKRTGILDADFFLADLLSKDDATLIEKLYVVLRGNHYELDRKIDAFGFLDAKRAEFKDGQAAHRLFWNRYRRPPKKEYWGYIAERRDLLVPQDVRERKGSYFTPQIWVEKAQLALADVLGENWQDEYDVWDCAAGVGNLLANLQNKYRVWASTLDQADVEVMRERIKNGANLLDSHVFRFDFLNGSFDDLPDGLKAIVQNPERRKKLVVFINPPYAEAGNKGQMTARGKNKSGVSFKNATYDKYHDAIGTAARELAALFLVRIYREIPGCVIANFATLKILQGVNFKRFRDLFQPKLESLFIVPANTFDNVKGDFPIGFFIWNGRERERFSEVTAQISVPVSEGSKCIGQKPFYSFDDSKFMLQWIRTFFDKSGDLLAYLRVNGQDMQNNAGVFLASQLTPNDFDNHFFFRITAANVLPMCVYYAVRRSTEHTTWNHNDQFLYPSDSWADDVEFQLDCLAYTLFHEKNRISCGAANISHGDTETRSDRRGNLRASVPPCEQKPATCVNHWIPFPESEVDAKDAYQSHFMVEFLRRVGAQPEKLAQSPHSSQSLFPETSRTSRTSREKNTPSQPLLFGGAGGPLGDRALPGGRIVDASLPVAAEAGAEYDALLRDGSNTETQSHGDTEQSRASAPLGLCASVLKSTRPEGRIPAFSPAALAVFDAGRALYRYYHAQPGAIPDASLYDIRAHFQGFKPNGHMNADSPDPEYTRLIGALRAAERALAARIAPKVRQHGFLR